MVFVLPEVRLINNRLQVFEALLMAAVLPERFDCLDVVIDS